jgi:hypothetical protein
MIFDGNRKDEACPGNPQRVITLKTPSMSLIEISTVIIKAEVRVWTLDVLQSPHDSSTPACGARQEAEIASLIWTFEAVVDPVALCVRALLPEGW